MTKKEAIAAKVNEYATCKGRIKKLSIIANNIKTPRPARMQTGVNLKQYPSCFPAGAGPRQSGGSVWYLTFGCK